MFFESVLESSLDPSTEAKSVAYDFVDLVKEAFPEIFERDFESRFCRIFLNLFCIRRFSKETHLEHQNLFHRFHLF